VVSKSTLDRCTPSPSTTPLHAASHYPRPPPAQPRPHRSHSCWSFARMVHSAVCSSIVTTVGRLVNGGASTHTQFTARLHGTSLTSLTRRQKATCSLRTTRASLDCSSIIAPKMVTSTHARTAHVLTAVTHSLHAVPPNRDVFLGADCQINSAPPPNRHFPTRNHCLSPYCTHLLPLPGELLLPTHTAGSTVSLSPSAGIVTRHCPPTHDRLSPAVRTHLACKLQTPSASVRQQHNSHHHPTHPLTPHYPNETRPLSWSRACRSIPCNSAVRLITLCDGRLVNGGAAPPLTPRTHLHTPIHTSYSHSQAQHHHDGAQDD
jgi:hypothetical protein